MTNAELAELNAEAAGRSSSPKDYGMVQAQIAIAYALLAIADAINRFPAQLP